MLVGSNIGENKIAWVKARRISHESNKLLTASRLSSGDLVTVRVGEPGTTAVIPPELDGCNCASMMVIRRHRSFDSSWLCYVMNSKIGRVQIENVQYGTAQKQFNISDAVEFIYPVPQLAEQEAIAEVLSDTDALIESLEQLIVKKRQIKQGAMQELLRPNAGWVEKQLDELADIRSGGTPSTLCSEYWGGNLPWCTPTDITGLTGYKYISTTKKMITPQGLKASSAEMIPARSIVMTSRATIGECAINRVPVSTNQGFKNFVPFEGIDAEFFFYLLQVQKQRFISLCGGSTFLEISKNQLLGYLVKLPNNEEEQRRIASILSDMDTEITALETKLAKARKIKQGMMAELLTGRIRLVESKPAQEPKWAFREAVIIAALADKFGSTDFPLGRKRCTKLTYLLHRRAEGEAQGYLKKAAGPYNPKTRYAGPEGIAQKSRYIKEHKSGKFNGFIAAGQIDQARSYFNKWYSEEILDWLEQFRRRTNDDLECLATVDMAIQDLIDEGKEPSLQAVRNLIASESEWRPKLKRAAFSNAKISAAIKESRQLFNHPS